MQKLSAWAPSSTWERETGVIADRDLGGRYWKLLACDEVRNLILQKTLKGDVFGTGVIFRMALGDGDLKVDLDMT